MPSQTDIVIIVEGVSPNPLPPGSRQIEPKVRVQKIAPGSEAIYEFHWRNADGSASELAPGEVIVEASFLPIPPGVSISRNVNSNPINQIIVKVEPGTPNLTYTLRVEGRP